MKKKILHLVPAMNIGGVEIGIQNSYSHLNEIYDYRVFSIKGAGTLNIPLVANRDFYPLFYKKNLRPDVIVSSLWPSHVIAYFLAQSGTPWIPFFHSAKEYSPIKRKIMQAALNRGHSFLFDSNATRISMGVAVKDPRSHICPYIFKTNVPESQKPLKDRDFDFIYVGRICEEKRIDLIRLFLSSLREYGIKFKVYLALAGTEEDFNLICSDFQRCGIEFLAERNLKHDYVIEKLRLSRFYILLSDAEGFSMGTVEAVQNGCIPIVRPVGEIPVYLERSAAVWVEESSAEGIRIATAALSKIWNRWEVLERMQSLGTAKLVSITGYVDAFSNAISHCLATRP
ncbi:MAG: glycosyltransferase [Acidobacteriota bacterium]